MGLATQNLYYPGIYRDGPGAGSGGMSRSASSYAAYGNMQAPDMEDVKESVKQVK